MSREPLIDRRRFLVLSAGGLVFAAGCSQGRTSSSGRAKTRATIGPDDPAVSAAERGRATQGAPVRRFDLRAAPATLELGRTTVQTWAYDELTPGQELRVTEGDVVEVALRNDLPEDTTIHWHGIALRNDMDGVHDLIQPPIAPDSAFTYRFLVPDPGTYFLHPHTGLQLDRALYAPLIIDDHAAPCAYDADTASAFVWSCATSRRCGIRCTCTDTPSPSTRSAEGHRDRAPRRPDCTFPAGRISSAWRCQRRRPRRTIKS